jgi:hypothetical protein
MSSAAPDARIVSARIHLAAMFHASNGLRYRDF